MHCNGFWATLPFSPSQAPWMLRGICARARSVTDRCFWRRWPGPETHPLHPLGSCSPGYSWGWHEKRAKEHKITSASALCVITAVYNEPEVNGILLITASTGKGTGSRDGSDISSRPHCQSPVIITRLLFICPFSVLHLFPCTQVSLPSLIL